RATPSLLTCHTYPFFCSHTSTTVIYTLSLHDALPICADLRVLDAHGLLRGIGGGRRGRELDSGESARYLGADRENRPGICDRARSEEHTSELQSHLNLVCRLLLEKKKNKNMLRWCECN